MNLHVALHYAARREHPDHLRRQLESVRESQRQAATAKERRRLERRQRKLALRLADAEAFAGYDWAAAEEDWVRFARGGIGTPGVYERWRRAGIPIAVLLKTGYEPRRRDRP